MDTDKKRIEERIEHYWDARSRDFGEKRRRELAGVNAQAWRSLFARYLPGNRQLHILDIGTGPGFFSILLSAMGHRCLGIDMSADMLREAAKNSVGLMPMPRYMKMNAQELHFPDMSFDVVVSRNLTWTLPHVSAAYREWVRVLRPGGILLNFDADYGKVTFAHRIKPAGVHAALSAACIEECDSIKSMLAISSKDRPAWDVATLEELGMEIAVERDIRKAVYRDERLPADDVPFFAIYAKKRV